MSAVDGRFGMVLALMLVLSACGNSDPRLLNVAAGNNSPDEFAVLPGKTLQTPANYTDLPVPTPGGTNITDAAPNAAAIVALGGNPAVLSSAGIPVADAELLKQVQRFGVSPNVRAELSAADLTLRRRRGALFFTRWLSRNRYFAAYRAQSLDQFGELARLRALGIKTPSAPPRTGR